MDSSHLPTDASPWPASILLASEAHVAASRNDTTARAKRLRSNSTVEVTFWIADPPAVSYYTFHCTKAPNPDSDEADEPPQITPQVVGAEDRFVLVSTLFRGRGVYEYFMYKGDPKSPSLESLPLPDDDFSLHRAPFAILPRGDDGHYLLIAIGYRAKMENYPLHIYSSEDATWTTKELPDPCPEIHIIPDKAFVIRDGLLLWVDLLRCMLLCDVVQEPHHAQYIPLPEPLLRNRERVKQVQREAKRIRDLTCVDGLINFIEMELREIVKEITVTEGVPHLKPIDPRTKDVLYDSDLIMLMKHKPVEPEIMIEVSVDGWSAITWTREIGSNCWRKGHIVDVNDILVDDSVFLGLLSGQRSEPESTTKSLTFKDLYSAWPSLSTDGNDVLYLKSYSESRGRGAVVAVTLQRRH